MTPRPRSALASPGRPRGRRVTLMDVARATGLSRTTVSDVLNRGDAAAKLYAPDTRRRIEQAVRDLGYAPAAAAQTLARGRSDVIGLVLLRGLTNPYFARLADAVEREVRRRGMRLQMAVSSDDDTADPADRARREAELIAQMRADAVEGLLLGPVYEDLDLREHAALIDGRLPTVLLGGGAADAPLDVVGDDAPAGWRLAGEHLRELGHRRVGFLCAPPSRVDPTRVDHLPAVRVLREMGLFAGPQWVAWHPDAGDLAGYAETCDAFAEQWLEADPATRPTAVLCLNDRTALAALGTLSRRGIAVPADLSVIGRDDLAEAAHLVPPLTTVANDLPGQARLAVARLLDRIADPAPPTGRTTVAPRLVVRASTAATPAG